MDDNTNIDDILKEIDEIFTFSHNIINGENFNLNDPYKKINYTYFRLFCTHFESLCILVQNCHLSSGILLMRAMLELFVKTFYLEFIEKEKEAIVDDFISGEKDFPSFFTMTKALEEYKHDSYGDFKCSFNQFTKKYLASYEKFSLFSHGRGEVLRAFYNHNKISYTTEQISEVLLTAKGMFEQLSLLLFFTQDNFDKVGLLLEKIKG
ncbi:hypothetical protein C7401_15238 [Paraburkholderia unamae]|uniref:hypothetical protein n=1 Tax=Paraburkholderia unamae TaxID=219649 RepID=UPI000DC53120|nr:hypothetical protein [Paraburkholderia unamae]RAR48286.1 hypothetical protein C7401_15238 [Paraburkholderia unamae]